jgi:hypothetical protein
VTILATIRIAEPPFGKRLVKCSAETVFVLTNSQSKSRMVQRRRMN